MLYRIVLHSKFPEGSDPATVKREFARVTGLTRDVTEQLFAPASTVIKRQVQRADAERIAATLRAVGVQTTVELEGGAPDNVPLGDPTVAPALDALAGGPVKPSPTKRLAGRLRTYTDVVLMVAALAGLGWALLQVYEHLHPPADLGKPVPKAAVTRPPVADAPAAPAPLKAANLEGPWRCTDQRTGLVHYWLYRADGTVVFNGESDFTKGEKPQEGPDVPIGWRLAGRKVVWLYPNKPEDAARANNVIELTLTRFDFEDAKGDAISCRRP
ncbi:MAG: hypothetical protein U1F48_13830 [Burkholderiales bacterium]